MTLWPTKLFYKLHYKKVQGVSISSNGKKYKVQILETAIKLKLAMLILGKQETFSMKNASSEENFLQTKQKQML